MLQIIENPFPCQMQKKEKKSSPTFWHPTGMWLLVLRQTELQRNMDVI